MQSIGEFLKKGTEFLLRSVSLRKKRETLSDFFGLRGSKCGRGFRGFRGSKSSKGLTSTTSITSKTFSTSTERRVLEVFLTKVQPDPLKRKLALLLFSGLSRREKITYRAVFESLNLVELSRLPLTKKERNELSSLLDKTGAKTVVSALDEMSVDLIKSVLETA